MPNRKYTGGGGYRYGFNGQEKQPEMGEGLYTAEFWEYDARIGRRFNVDPKPNVSISVYACFANNPIVFVDSKGDTVKFDSKDEEKDYSLYKKQITNRLAEVNENISKKVIKGQTKEKLEADKETLEAVQQELLLLENSIYVFRLKSGKQKSGQGGFFTYNAITGEFDVNYIGRSGSEYNVSQALVCI